MAGVASMKLGLKIAFLVSLLVLAFVLYTSRGKDKRPKVSLPKIAQISSFELKDQDNKDFSYEDLKGKVWVANFVFTRCQGPCPLITSKMAELQAAFSDDKNVHSITISMDASFDSPEILKAFGAKHGADFSTWHFLTGNPDKIVEIARTIFKVPADKDPEMHTTRFVLVDADGFIRGYYDSLEPQSLSSLKNAIESLQE